MTAIPEIGGVRPDSARSDEGGFRATFELAAVGMAQVGLDGRFLRVNRTFCRIMGHEQADLLALTFQEITHSDDLERDLAQVGRLLRGEYETLTVEKRYRRKDGSVFWGRPTASVVRDAHGRPEYLVVVLVDITERKLAQQALVQSRDELEAEVKNRTAELTATNSALRQSEAQIRLIADSLPVLIAYVGPDLRYRFVNRTLEDWRGITPAQAVGRRIDETLPKKVWERVGPHVLAGLSGRASDFETETRLNDGSLRQIHARYVPHLNEDGSVLGLVALLQDITELKRRDQDLRAQLEREVEERTAELRAAQADLLRQERLATLGRLTATVSHELRNPLGVIRTSAYIARNAAPETSPRLQRALERIERNVIRCDRIIDELLDVTRSSDLALHATPFDAWLKATLQEQLVPASIRLRQDLRLTGLTVLVDQERLRRAIINVFDNACQAMLGDNERHPDRPNHVLSVSTRLTAGRIEIAFHDTGPGIAEDILPRIFEPLYSTKSFGVGLGLPVVKQILEQHGGGIEVETAPGCGALVCLWLPEASLVARPEGRASGTAAATPAAS